MHARCVKFYSRKRAQKYCMHFRAKNRFAAYVIIITLVRKSIGQFEWENKMGQHFRGFQTKI